MANFRQKQPRAESEIIATCYAKPVLFMELDDMPQDAKDEFEKNGPIPCEGGGVPGVWCNRCRFGEVSDPIIDPPL
jgi:hypothetical protein